jgi:hypothetical protein
VVSAGLVFGLAAASGALAAGVTRYSGHTSQGKAFPVTLTISAGHRLTFTIKYTEQCYTPNHTRAASSRGSFGFHPVGGGGVAPDRHGRFSHKAQFHHQPTTAHSEYFNSTDKVSGRITGKTASGTFSFDGRFYKGRGTYLGSCQTGTLHWSVRKR